MMDKQEKGERRDKSACRARPLHGRTLPYLVLDAHDWQVLSALPLPSRLSAMRTDIDASSSHKFQLQPDFTMHPARHRMDEATFEKCGTGSNLQCVVSPAALPTGPDEGGDCARQSVVDSSMLGLVLYRLESPPCCRHEQMW